MVWCTIQMCLFCLFHECLYCASCLIEAQTGSQKDSNSRSATRSNFRLHHMLIFPVVDAQIQLWASWRFITPTNSRPQSSCQTTLNFRTGNNVCLRQWPRVHWRPCPCPSPEIYRYIQKVSWRRTNLQLNYQHVISKLLMVLEEYMFTKSGHDYTWHKSTIAQCGSHCS